LSSLLDVARRFAVLPGPAEVASIDGFLLNNVDDPVAVLSGDLVAIPSSDGDDPIPAVPTAILLLPITISKLYLPYFSSSSSYLSSTALIWASLSSYSSTICLDLQALTI